MKSHRRHLSMATESKLRCGHAASCVTRSVGRFVHWSPTVREVPCASEAWFTGDSSSRERRTGLADLKTMIVCRHDVVLASVLVSLSRNTYRLTSVSLHDTLISHLDVSSARLPRLDACAPVVGFTFVWARCSVSCWSRAVDIGCVL